MKDAICAVLRGYAQPTSAAAMPRRPTSPRFPGRCHVRHVSSSVRADSGSRPASGRTIARPPPWIPPAPARDSPPAPLRRAGEWPFPPPPGSDTIPIACRPAVQCTPCYPAGLALLPLASPPYGPPDKGVFVVEIVIKWPICLVTRYGWSRWRFLGPQRSEHFSICARRGKRITLLSTNRKVRQLWETRSSSSEHIPSLP
jgi:hypothetical protein